MAHPLEVSYNWRTPVLFASIGVSICVGVLIRGQVRGWVSAVVVIFALWVAFVGLAYLRTRAYLMVDGPRLTVRRFRRFHTVEGAELVAVRQFLTPSGPSYALSVRGAGGPQRVVAPVALLRRGHATLFEWILAYAPDADLDKGSRKTLDQLRERGLVL
ncbi:MAG TPA: hypothetical protein VIT20_04555 [Propionibacteriaceae bacterium]